MYVMPNGGTAQGGGDINSALQSLRSAVGYARPPGGVMDPSKRRALPTGRPGGISAMPTPAIKPLIDQSGAMQQSPPWAASTGQDQVQSAPGFMKPDILTLQDGGMGEKEAAGQLDMLQQTGGVGGVGGGAIAKINEMQDGGMPQSIPAPPASGPIMDQTAMQNFQGRAGGMQSMGPGRFGGAPPANVLARRQALNGRLRNRLAQFGGAAGPPPFLPPPGAGAELGGAAGGMGGFSRGPLNY